MIRFTNHHLHYVVSILRTIDSNADTRGLNLKMSSQLIFGCRTA